MHISNHSYMCTLASRRYMSLHFWRLPSDKGELQENLLFIAHFLLLFIVFFKISLKLYCRYEYTKPCMINRIWCLKQLWLQVNGHAWFHLQQPRWHVLNGEGAKYSKWKYMWDSDQHHASPRQESQRLRPLDHEGLMVISGLMSYRIMGFKF